MNSDCRGKNRFQVRDLDLDRRLKFDAKKKIVSDKFEMAIGV